MADSTIMKTLNGYEICDSIARGMSPVVAASEDGASYTATVGGITALTSGINFVMVPSVDNTVVAPTLNVNGLGEKQIRLQLSTSSRTTTPGGVDENETPKVWLVQDAPIKVTYDDGAAGVGAWVADITMPDMNTAYGVLPVANGGTGCDNLADLKTALESVGEGGVVEIESGGTGADNADMARSNLGAAAISHEHDADDIVSGTFSPDRLPIVPIERGGTGRTTGAARMVAGAIIAYAGATVPDGYLFCNGQAVSRTDYAELFAAIGTTYGSGDGSTTFNVPNLYARFPLGGGGGNYPLGKKDGEYSHTLTVNEMPSHNHSTSTSAHGGHSHGLRGYNVPATNINADVSGDSYSGLSGSGKKVPCISDTTYGWTQIDHTSTGGDHTHTVTVNNTGGGAAHNNMPPYTVVAYIISTGL